jgi:putative DNA primase/helicase
MWWKATPAANIGVRTGAGLVVLDVDPRNGGDRTLKGLLNEHGELPTTWTVHTGGGGEHYYFGVEGDVPTRSALFEGIDLKGVGGFVVAPPSLHASGKRYVWAQRRGPRDLDLAAAPAWLLIAANAPLPPKKNVADLRIREGGRNAHLASFAGRARRKGLEGDELLRATLEENKRRCEPPLARPEVERVVASISRYPVGANGHDLGTVLDSTGASKLTKQSAASDREHVLRRLSDLAPTLDRVQNAVLRDELVRRRMLPARLVDAALHTPNTDAGTATQGQAVTLTDPMPWEEPVNGVMLLGELVGAIRRHVVLPECAADAVALWILHTHALNAAQITPRLAILSPEKRCGKTTMLKILSRLVRRPLPTTNVTAAALFRTIEKFQPTLLVDEADTFLSEREELRGILNTGHDRLGAEVIRCAGDDAEPRRFATWAPVALAAIGKIHDTLSDRSVVIGMKRRTADESVAPLRRKHQAELAPLPRKCARWAADNGAQLTGLEVEGPPELNDRAADNWEALLAIADVAGGEWPARARRAALALSVGPDEEDQSSRAQLLLADVRGLFERTEGDRLTTKELLRELNGLEGRPWADYSRGKGLSAHQMAANLRRFGIQPRNLRTASGVVKGYMSDDFRDAFARYLGSRTATSANPAEAGASTETNDPLQSGSVADAENTPSGPFWPEVAAVAAGEGEPLNASSTTDDEYAILAGDGHEEDPAQFDGNPGADNGTDAYELAERRAIEEFGS